jgi:hypothetical protein
MRTADECFAKARELSKLAEGAPDTPARDALLGLARTWVVVAAEAKWQDNHPHSKTYRVQ